MRGRDVMGAATLAAPPREDSAARQDAAVEGPSALALARSVLRDRALWAVLGLALGLRLAAWWLAPKAELLGDEREYYSAAAIMADGRGFSFFDQSLCVRPPLDVVLLAGLFRVFGPGMLPVWTVQTALSLATVALAGALARLCYDGQHSETGSRAVIATRLAAGLCALYLPFAVYTRFLLSETLFTFLVLLAFVALTGYARGWGRGALALAGLAFGAAILTRGLALPFLAAVSFWLATVHRRPGRASWTIVARRSALVIGLALLVVAPWTARNALAYGRLIPVDTTGGYNFWLGALGGRDAGQINNALREVANHGDRQALAWARGWAVVRADPGAYAAKSWKEFRDLWGLNFSAYERLLGGFALGRVPVAWLGLTLVLDDLLYLLALPLAPVGWALTRRDEDRRLLGLWIGWNCLAGAVFFAIARFRLPLMPFVFILAARALAELPTGWALRGAHGRGRFPLAPALAVVAVVALVYPSFAPAPGLYRLGAARAAAAARLERGYDLLAERQPEAALAAFETLPHDFYARPTALAAAYHALGQDERALALLDEAVAADRDSLGVTLLLGDILRAQGRTEAALEVLNYREVRVANPTEQAWERLFPPPLARLDIGNGLDLGYLRGVTLNERDGDGTTFRWTGSRAELRLVAPGGPATLRLRLSSYRPVGPPPPVHVSVAGRPLGVILPGGEWQVHELPLVTAARPETVVVRLETATFVLGYADQRQLGLKLDWAEIAPASAGR